MCPVGFFVVVKFCAKLQARGPLKLIFSTGIISKQNATQKAEHGFIFIL